MAMTKNILRGLRLLRWEESDLIAFSAMAHGDLRAYLADGLLKIGTLVISAGDATKFKTTTTAVFNVAGVTYTKLATDALVFSAAHVITASKYGAILVQINAAGAVSTLITGATQTTALAHNSAALALAALPAPTAGNVALGHIAIANNTGDWTALTDDLTDASDVTTAAFVDGTAKSLSAAFTV